MAERCRPRRLGYRAAASLVRCSAVSRSGTGLLEWAPDLFAFTDVVLDRPEAYRFAVSPPESTGWPPPELSDWSLAIAYTSAGWCAWVEGDGTELDRGDHTGVAMPEAPADHERVVSLEATELTILTCWAQAVAETLAASPDQLDTILDDARAGAARRRKFGVAEPSAGGPLVRDHFGRAHRRPEHGPGATTGTDLDIPVQTGPLTQFLRDWD